MHLGIFKYRSMEGEEPTTCNTPKIAKGGICSPPEMTILQDQQIHTAVCTLQGSNCYRVPILETGIAGTVHRYLYVRAQHRRNILQIQSQLARRTDIILKNNHPEKVKTLSK